MQFWRNHYRPDQAALVVVGDIAEAELRQLAERLFARWQRPATAHAVTAATTSRSSTARVVFVDKPGAPQTALAVVSVGPRAAAPDAPAVTVMNAALGGLFTSRINTQLREVKGYTYAVFSRFVMGRDSGQFIIRGSVRTEVTGAALVDLFKEISDVRTKPLGPQELARVRNAELLSLPGQFDTNRSIMHSYAADWAAGLPADHIVRLPARLAAVNAGTAHSAAKDHVDPDRLIVVAVGDKAQVLPQLQALKREPLEQRDASGAPLK
jgi:zinc protease